MDTAGKGIGERLHAVRHTLQKRKGNQMKIAMTDKRNEWNADWEYLYIWG
ncbi:MAG: hypothetical protein ACMUJM_21925 [bacterium]